MDKLFAYGTLREPKTLERVLGRLPPMRPAVLRGYERVRHPRLFYASVQAKPALSRSPERSEGEAEGGGAQVQGAMVEGITEDEWAKLDAYETAEYERKVATVALADTGEQVEAFVYVHTEQAAVPLVPANEADYKEEHPVEERVWKVMRVSAVILALVVVAGAVVWAVDYIKFGGQPVEYSMARVAAKTDRAITVRIDHRGEIYTVAISLPSYRRRWGRVYPYAGQTARVRYQIGRNGRDVRILDLQPIWPSEGR